MDIDWTQQPTDKHLALIVTHNSKLIWVKEDSDSYFQCLSVYPKRAEGDLFTIHHKPIATPYQPEVGGWCEWSTASIHWSEAFYIGINDGGHRVFNNRDDKMFFVPSGLGLFRPIKSERELFIQQCIDIAGRSGLIPEEAFGKLYSNGARFNEVAE